MTRITTLADPEAVAQRAARDIERALRGAIERRGGAHLALSGGTTPARTYELLAASAPGWESVQVWFADERCVPPEDEQSNYLMTDETLLSRVPLTPVQVHRMRGELGPEEGARLYGDELRKLVPGDGEQVPVLDLIVLGIGPDGHVASLFPDSPTLDDAAVGLDTGEQTVCLGVHDSPKPPPQRITLSLAVLRAARRCMLLATGEGKAAAITAAMGTPTAHVPASLLRRERLTVIVDDQAAPAPAS